MAGMRLPPPQRSNAYWLTAHGMRPDEPVDAELSAVFRHLEALQRLDVARSRYREAQDDVRRAFAAKDRLAGASSGGA